MDKVIWKLIGELKKKLTGEWSYFLGNVLVGVRVVFLLDCSLVLSLLKGCRGIFEQKNKDPK